MELDLDQKIMLKNLQKNYNDKDFNYCQLLPGQMGIGKTRIALHLIKSFYKKLNIKPFIICPKTLIPMWEKSLKELSIEAILITTYNMLAGTKQSGCNHPYLKRSDTGYRVTKQWKKYDGVFIVCDESQAIKNKKSARHWASFTLISNNKQGKLLHLTASPIDKKDNWICLYRNLGIVDKKLMLLYHKKEYSYKHYGLGQVLDIVKTHNKKLYDSTMNDYDIKSKNLASLLSHLWSTFFIHKYVIKVVDPIYKDIDGNVYENKICNYFATLDKKGLKMLDDEVAKLKIKDGDISESYIRRNVGQIQLFLMKLCNAKINTIVRLTKDKLTEKHRKVIICCPYIEAQDVLYTKLHKYNPLILNGKSKNRQTIIDSFNEANDDHRCLIMTAEVGGEGVNLHDTHGKYPRTMYIVPTYSFLKMYQSSGRTYRRGMKSNVEVYILYSNDGLIENIIVNTLAKSEVASAILLPGSGKSISR
jgi:hypothetical protein